MDPTPVVISVLLTSVVALWGWISGHSSVVGTGTPASQLPVAGLVTYCAQVSAALEANPALRSSESGEISLPASAPPTGAAYANWASGPPAYTLQCWMVSPPAGGGLQAALAAAPGDPTVGIAETPTEWKAAIADGSQQVMPETLSESEVGTVVVLSGY